MQIQKEFSVDCSFSTTVFKGVLWLFIDEEFLLRGVLLGVENEADVQLDESLYNLKFVT